MYFAVLNPGDRPASHDALTKEKYGQSNLSLAQGAPDSSCLADLSRRVVEDPLHGQLIIVDPTGIQSDFRPFAGSSLEFDSTTQLLHSLGNAANPESFAAIVEIESTSVVSDGDGQVIVVHLELDSDGSGP